MAYAWSTASVGLKWRYIDAMRDADPLGAGFDYRIGAVDYLDLFAEKAFESGILSGLTRVRGR